MMSKKLAMALVPLLMAGCGDDLVDENKDGIADGIQRPGSVTAVAPATPTGTVAGQVLNSRFQPVEGVEVTMTVGGALQGTTVTTDATGSFAIKDVPAGSRVLLTFSKAGLATARATASIPAEAGNVPLNNANANFGPVVMAETNGTVRFHVYAPSARPATGARATLVVDGASYLLSSYAETLQSQVVVHGEVSADGVLTFNGVPSPEEGVRLGARYTLHISPLDANNDGIPEADGEVRTFTGNTLLTGGASTGLHEALTIQLSSAVPSAALAIKYSNLGSLRDGMSAPQSNMVAPGEPISIAFNKPIQPNSLIVSLTDEYGRERLGVTNSLGAGNTYLSITPNTALVAGSEYNLHFRAVAISDGTTVQYTVPFVAGDPANPPALAIKSIQYWESGTPNGQLDSGEIVAVHFNQVVRLQVGVFAQVYLDEELDGNAASKVVGEWNPGGNNLGFYLNVYEPQTNLGGIPADASPVQPIVLSGYSSRFYFTYTASSRVFPSGSNLKLVLNFAKNAPANSIYETAWGVPQLTDLHYNGPIQAVAP